MSVGSLSQVLPRWLTKFCTSRGCKHAGLRCGRTPGALQPGNGMFMPVLPRWQYVSGFIQSYLFVPFDVCVTSSIICTMTGLRGWSWQFCMTLIHQVRKDTSWYSCNTCSFPLFLLDTENGPSYLNIDARRGTLSTSKMSPFTMSRLILPASPASSMHVKIHHLWWIHLNPSRTLVPAI